MRNYQVFAIYADRIVTFRVSADTKQHAAEKAIEVAPKALVIDVK